MRKKLIFLIFFSVIVVNNLINAYPMRFTRLVETDEQGGLKRTVDLIYDSHIKIFQPTKKMLAQEYAKLMQPQEKQIPKLLELGKVERALAKEFRKLAELSNEKIDLIWEWGKTTASKPGFKENHFLAYFGKIFEQEFAITQNKQIRFIYGDTYRKDILHPSTAFQLGQSRKVNFLKAREESLESFNTLIEKMKDELLSKKNKLPKVFYDFLQNILNQIKETITGFLKKYDAAAAVLSDQTMSLSEFVVQNDLVDDFNKLTYEIYINTIEDFELLIRILTSDASHIVVVAGGNHCRTLSQWLVAELNFKKVTDIGIEGEPKDFFATLSTSAWDYLLENPADSVKRPIVDCIIPPGKWKVRSKMSYKREIQWFMDFISKYSKCYVDIINAISKEENKTILHEAVKINFVPLIAWLLENKAHVNVKDKDGRTPLFYANTPETAQKLILAGAVVNVFDNSKITPLFSAISRRNAALARILLEAGANIRVLPEDTFSSHWPNTFSRNMPGEILDLIKEYETK